MIIQHFDIPEYNWKVTVYYYVDTYYTQEILRELRLIGCRQDNLEDARKNLTRNELNSGLCYSNSSRGESIIVIARATSKEQFMNSCFHEATHLLSHIEQEYDINPYTEKAAYLMGYIGQLMFNTAKLFLCDCHRGKLDKMKGTC